MFSYFHSSLSLNNSLVSINSNLDNLSKVIASQQITEQAIESSNSEFKEVLKRTLTNNTNKAKTYLAFARLQFSHNEAGDRMLMLVDAISCKACTIYNTSIAYTKYIVVEPNTNFDVVVKALQNSGSTISVQGFLQIIELT